jgi:hypothetical protein
MGAADVRRVAFPWRASGACTAKAIVFGLSPSPRGLDTARCAGHSMGLPRLGRIWVPITRPLPDGSRIPAGSSKWRPLVKPKFQGLRLFGTARPASLTTARPPRLAWVQCVARRPVWPFSSFVGHALACPGERSSPGAGGARDLAPRDGSQESEAAPVGSVKSE